MPINDLHLKADAVDALSDRCVSGHANILWTIMVGPLFQTDGRLRPVYACAYSSSSDQVVWNKVTMSRKPGDFAQKEKAGAEHWEGL